MAHAQAFQRHGRWHIDVAGIRRGDIVFFDWDKVSGRTVKTIEGNISDRCPRKVRDASTIVGYGRPAYSDKPSPYVPFPGTKFFVTGRKSPIVRRVAA